MAGAFAVAHFDEDDGVAVAHHQVQLAVACGVVAREQFEAGAFEFEAGALLEVVAGGAHQPVMGWVIGSKPLPEDDGLAGAGALAGGAAEGMSSICRLPPRGRARPFWNWAQISTRRTRPNWSAASWPLAPGM